VRVAQVTGYDDPTAPDPATSDAYRAAYARYRALTQAQLGLIAAPTAS
jgi:hypothetical protein